MTTNNAKYVLVVKAGACTVIKNGRECGHKVAPMIAVYTEASNGELKLRLEIGLRRTHPYRRVESGGKVFLWKRAPAESLKEGEFSVVYPHILKCIEDHLIETIVLWKDDGERSPRGKIDSRRNLRGIRLTVKKSDLLIYHAFMREHKRHLTEVVLRDYAQEVLFALRYLNFSQYTTYPPSVKETIDRLVVTETYRNNVLLHTLLDLCGSRKPLIKRALFSLKSVDVDTEKAPPDWLRTKGPGIERIRHDLRFRCTNDRQPKCPSSKSPHFLSDEKGFAVFEVIFNPLVKSEKVKRLWASYNENTPTGDDDIPF